MPAHRISRRGFIAAAGISAAALTLNSRKLPVYADDKKHEGRYPVVVIGAGLGGLTCAAYLAGRGVPVTVVEQHSIPGGYATAFDRAGGKYIFEVSLHGTSIHNNTPARILDELGILDKLELVPLPETYRIKTESGDVIIPQADPEGLVRELSTRFPQEADGIRGFVSDLLAVYDETEAYGKKGSAFKTVTKPFFPLLYRNMWKVRTKTLEDMLAEHIRSPELRSLLSFLWGYYGLPPSKLSGFYYAVATGDYLKNGSFYIKDRSQRLSDLLAESIEAAGGKILYNTTAERILLEKGAVSGVSVSGGKILPARTVVCNGSAPTLFERMLPEKSVPADYLRRLESYRPSLSSFIVWLGLNRSITREVPGYSTDVQSHRSPEECYESALTGDIENASYSVTLYDHLFEGYSAPGSSTLMILSLCGYEPWRPFETDYEAGRKDAYQAEKDRWTETLIRRAEKDLIPGLSSMIEVQDAATPLTNRRFTGNTEGAVYGFEQSLENAYMNRIPNKTPVQGLYLAGAWGNPGGGYAGVLHGGRSAFETILRDWGV